MKKEFVIKELPADFCHASTIIKLSNDTFMCCWFGGQTEGSSDTAIWGSIKANGCWSMPVKIADGAEANWNPVLFCNEDKLWLFYKEGQKIAEWKTYLLESDDNGVTWSSSRELVTGDCSGGRGPVRNKPIRLANGDIIAGGSVERGLWTAFADFSHDGLKWQRSLPIKIATLAYRAGEKTAESDIAVSEQSFYGRGVIQPSLWESTPGVVHMLLRSSEGFVYRSDSADGGKTWTDAYQTSLVNNNSGIDLVKACFDGCLYLVCNPVGSNWGMRSPLSLLRSADNGLSWQKIADLETEPGEFSYPAIIDAEEGLYITYTWQRKNIVHVFFSADEL